MLLGVAKPETLDALLTAGGFGRFEAAQEAGISPTSLRDWCEGIRPPRRATALKLAEALGVPVLRVLAAAAVSRKRAK